MNDLKQFIQSISTHSLAMQRELNLVKDKLGQQYFNLHSHNQRLAENINALNIYFDLEIEKSTDTSHEKISLKELNAKIQKHINSISIKNLSITSESELISLEKEIEFNEIKLKTMVFCLAENAIAQGASSLHFSIAQKNNHMTFIATNNGKSSDKNKSAPFQKIGHKLVLKICKQLAYDVDFIKSDKGLTTKIIF